MPRRRYKKKQTVLPDHKYGSILVARFINKILKKGKKDIATKIIYNSFDIISEKTKKEALEVFEKAIDNASPLLEVKSKRIGGANYQIPVKVEGDRKTTLAMRWIIEAANTKKGKPMHEKIATEIIEAYNNTGDAIKKRENTHKMAEANRAFAYLAKF